MSAPLIESMIAAVEASPTDLPLRLHLAELLVTAGRGPEAVTHLAVALQQDPGHDLSLSTSTLMMIERDGGQRRMALGAGTAATRFGPVTETAGAEHASPPPPTPESVTANAAEPAPPVPDVAQAGGGPKRPAHTGLSIRFETGREDAALGRLVESTVWVNDAHPAYRRAVATHAESYHIALTVGMTLAPLAADGAAIQNFVTTFLARWGETNGQHRRRGRR